MQTINISSPGQPISPGDRYQIVRPNGTLQVCIAPPAIPNPPSYKTAAEAVLVNAQPMPWAGTDVNVPQGTDIELYAEIVDDTGTRQTWLDQPALGWQAKTLLIPINKVVGNQIVDEVYFVVTLANGAMHATGQIPTSGPWKILPQRMSEAIASLGVDWRINYPAITLLVAA